jgi:hypothetical protein
MVPVVRVVPPARLVVRVGQASSSLKNIIIELKVEF